MGTYCPPLAVFIDNAFLASLEPRHLSNGSAEILKMACIKDAALFELLEKHATELLRTNFQVGHQRFVRHIAHLSAIESLPPTPDVLAGLFVLSLMWRCDLASVLLCHCAIIFRSMPA